MGLIATIHTTDIDQMAELVAAARLHGPVEVCYVDGGLELHRATSDHQAEPEPTAPAPAPAKPTAPKKAAPAKANAVPTCPECAATFASPNGLAIHRARKHGTAGAHAHRRTPKPLSTTATTSPAEPATFTVDTPIARNPINHDAARDRAAQAI